MARSYRRHLLLLPSGAENLCDHSALHRLSDRWRVCRHTVADARYAFKLPEGYSDAEAAPLLCAGLIGYRSLKMAGDARRLGIYGFGAAAHILAQVARHQGREIYAFTRPGDTKAQDFARELGAAWAGGSDETPPERARCRNHLRSCWRARACGAQGVRKGGVVVCGGIHMSDIPTFPYEILWEERVLRSVANLTRADAREFLALAPQAGVRTTVVKMPTRRRQ